jgi:hypothetical protein
MMLDFQTTAQIVMFVVSFGALYLALISDSL